MRGGDQAQKRGRERFFCDEMSLKVGFGLVMTNAPQDRAWL